MAFATIGFALGPPATDTAFDTKITATDTASTVSTATAAPDIGTTFSAASYRINTTITATTADNSKAKDEATATDMDFSYPARYKRMTPNLDDANYNTPANGRYIRHGPLKRGATRS